MRIRKYNSSDCAGMAELFYQTVHSVNAMDYTQAQLDVWATGHVDLAAWDRSFSDHFTVVAVEDGCIVGFGDMDPSGYLDRLYVHKDHQRKGIASAICDSLEETVPGKTLVTHASITAKPFFEQRGYRVVRGQTVIRGGISLTNYVMERCGGRPGMLAHVEWLFFDVGSTIIDESAAYAHRFSDIAQAAGKPYDEVYETAMGFYRENRKGDKETARLFGVPLTKWHTEDERLYNDAASCLEALHRSYRIGIIANQNLGTAQRLEQHGILQHIDLVIASAEEGVAKPDHRIFEIALHRTGCAPENAVMIGDRIDNDIVPAKSLGMHTIWIRQGFGQYWNLTEEEEMPEHTVNDLTGLFGIL